VYSCYELTEELNSCLCAAARMPGILSVRDVLNILQRNRLLDLQLQYYNVVRVTERDEGLKPRFVLNVLCSRIIFTQLIIEFVLL